MRRFTILSLMGVVFVLAVGLAALRGANDYWAGGLLLGTPLLFGLSLIAAFSGKDGKRAGRTGFAVLGGGYFALAFLGLSEGNLRRLPTSWLLQYVHEQVGGQANVSVVFSTITTTNQGGTVLTQNVSGTRLGIAANAPATLTGNVVFNNSTTTTVSGNTWKFLLPGVANNDSFNAVGHCLFALLAGVLGAAIARRLEKEKERVADQPV